MSSLENYYFPSLLYIKDNLYLVLESLFEDEENKYAFIVYNEVERILKSKDTQSIRTLITLISVECRNIITDFYKQNKHSEKLRNFNIDEQTEILRKLLLSQIS